MKIIYLTNARLPTEWAHGLQIMKTCEALAATGAELELWMPHRKSYVDGSPFSFYGLKEAFRIRRFFTLDPIGWGKIGFFLQSLSFAFAVLPHARRARPDAFYCRDEILVAMLSFLGVRRFVWESHDGVWNRWGRRAAERSKKIVVVSHGLKDFYVQKGIPAEKIAVIPNGIDLEAFAHPQSKEESRMRLGLPHDKKIALYIGMLERWKGTDTLLTAAPLFPAQVEAVIIGGEGDAQIAPLQQAYPMVRFLGYRPQRELPDNQSAADVLILPNTAKNEIGLRFSSPLKLLSYMASGKPIVASDLPSIREIVDESCAFLVRPDDPEALVHGIEEALADTAEAARRAKTARKRLEAFTWTARARKILDILGAP